MPELLDGSKLFALHAFTDALPIPDVIDTERRSSITIQIREFDQFLGLYDDQGLRMFTTVWGYKAGNLGGYPGPTIIAYENTPITIRWQNHLPVDGHLLPVDTSIHLAQPISRPLEAGFVPIVSHLHGGHNLSAFDGLPEQWFTQNRSGPGGTGPREVGPDFVSSTAQYLNDQHSATLWYHDHSLGITRLNVYAGLAGFYLVQDSERLELQQQGVLPAGSYDLGIVIQDRAFTADGQLYYPAFKNDPLPGTDETVGDVVPQAFYDAMGEGAASIVPEFFGDTILVNGMAWPNLDVAAGDYNFRILNGSDSRFYLLSVSDPTVAMYLVGTDGGLLPHAVTISDGDGLQEPGEFILLAPGDRVELVFDFSKLEPGDVVRLLNSGPLFEPFKGVTTDGNLLGGAQAASADDAVGNIMQFTVTAATPFYAQLFDGSEPVALTVNFVSLVDDVNADGIADAASNIRYLGLFEGVDEFGRVTPMLGKAEPGTIVADMGDVEADFGPLSFAAAATETPILGSTEQWSFFNFTADSHPIHVHLVQYQVVEKRQIFFQDQDEDGVPDDTTGDGLISYGYGSSPDYLNADIWIGDEIALRPEESGWQDTVAVDPGTMMSIVATFDLAGEYVWHCHILSHEDNEMMRPYVVENSSVAQATTPQTTQEQMRQAPASGNNPLVLGAIAAAGIAATPAHANWQFEDQISADQVGVIASPDTATSWIASELEGPNSAAIGYMLHQTTGAEGGARYTSRGESSDGLTNDYGVTEGEADAQAAFGGLPAGTALSEPLQHAQVIALGVAMPSAEQLQALDRSIGAAPEGSPTNQMVSSVVMDALWGGGDGPDLEALLSTLRGDASGAAPAVEALASYVPPAFAELGPYWLMFGNQFEMASGLPALHPDSMV